MGHLLLTHEKIVDIHEQHIGEGAAPLCNISVWEPRFGGFTWSWEA